MSSALAIAAIATSVAGAGMGAVGAAKQGKQAQQLANFNAQVAENNAIAARQKADFDAKRAAREAKFFQASKRAGVASSGGELLDAQSVFDMDASEIALEQLAIKYGGELAAQAGQQNAQIARFQGATAASNAKGKAVGSILTGLGSAAGGISKLPSGSSPAGTFKITGGPQNEFFGG